MMRKGDAPQSNRDVSDNTAPYGYGQPA